MPNTAAGPQCVSMVICDYVVREPLSGKANLLGVMNALRLFSVPVIYPGIRVYATITNMKGRYEVAVVGMHEPTQRLIKTPGAEKQVISCDDPDGFLDIIAAFTRFRIPEPGVYRFTLTINGVPIAHRRLAVQIPSQNPPPPLSPPTDTPPSPGEKSA